MVADAFPPFLLRSTGSGNIVTVYERRHGQCGMAAGPAARSSSSLASSSLASTSLANGSLTSSGLA
jgi:hypothetical protein